VTTLELADRLAMLNALLNGSATVFLVSGWIAIRRDRRDVHKKLMLTALAISALFLVSYLTRLSLSGTHTYPLDAPFRRAYLAMLISHVCLATLVPVIALRSVWLAYRGRFAAHRRWNRVGLPIWLYVSVTGVAVYLWLYGALGKL
jgi:putative membrane protein